MVYRSGSSQPTLAAYSPVILGVLSDNPARPTDRAEFVAQPEARLAGRPYRETGSTHFTPSGAQRGPDPGPLLALARARVPRTGAPGCHLCRGRSRAVEKGHAGLPGTNGKPGPGRSCSAPPLCSERRAELRTAQTQVPAPHPGAEVLPVP